MSTPISAFAAYQSTASKKSNGSSKNRNNEKKDLKQKIKRNKGKMAVKTNTKLKRIVKEEIMKKVNARIGVDQCVDEILGETVEAEMAATHNRHSDISKENGAAMKLLNSVSDVEEDEDEEMNAGPSNQYRMSSFEENRSNDDLPMTSNDDVEISGATEDLSGNAETLEDEPAFSLQALREHAKKRKAEKRKIQATAAKKSPVNKTPVARASSTPNNSGSASISVSTSKKTYKQVQPMNLKYEKLSPEQPTISVVKMNSIEEGRKLFGWVLEPLTTEDFLAKYWEKHACLIRRQADNYYTNLLTFEGIHKMFLNNYVEFTKNIDITSYTNGERETLNPEGRAMPAAVWDFYSQGCSIRLLNPQTFFPAVYSLNVNMQEFFHCFVGANVYLTPPNSQGFAPHFDDIEAFVLQVEGKKRWKLYKPRTQTELLPRYSSENFKQDEIGEPIFDEVLHAGDILYFPRGTIHQACTEPGHHSLHITLSVYQKHSYADFFEKLMPLMLQRAIASDIDMRLGLPLTTFQNAGLAFNECDSAERHAFIESVQVRLKKMLKSDYLEELIDDAVDQVAKKFQHEALPPEILPLEKVRTVFGSRFVMNKFGECLADYKITITTNVRLLRANIVRLLKEDGKLLLYYYLDNSKSYCEYELNYMEIEQGLAASVEVLIKSYPAYVGVSELPMKNDEDKIDLVNLLWERGLLMLEKPIQ